MARSLKVGWLWMIVGLFCLMGAWRQGALGQERVTIRYSDAPFISGGAFYIAWKKGYFERLGLDIQFRSFPDGAFAVPPLVAGELDMVGLTPNAGLFNSIARGLDVQFILDRGRERKGRSYVVINVSKALYDQGVKGLADFAKLKGKKIGVGALGSINQYTMALALEKAGLDPTKDVEWNIGASQPDIMKMLGRGIVDATNLAYQIGFAAQKEGFGPIVATSDEVAPDGQIAALVVTRSFLSKHREAVVHFAMAYIQGAKEFNRAAANPGQFPEIVDILAKNTFLRTADLVKAIAPNWSYIEESGVPNRDSILAMQDYWHGTFKLVKEKVPADRLFDLSIARDAAAHLAREKPFGP